MEEMARNIFIVGINLPGMHSVVSYYADNIQRLLHNRRKSIFDKHANVRVDVLTISA